MCSMCIKTNQVGKQEVGIWWVQKRLPHEVPICSLWRNIRFLSSIVAEKNASHKMGYLYEACDEISDFCHPYLLRKMRWKMRIKINWFEPTIYCTRGKHTNHYTTDAVSCIYGMNKRINNILCRQTCICGCIYWQMQQYFRDKKNSMHWSMGPLVVKIFWSNGH